MDKASTPVRNYQRFYDYLDQKIDRKISDFKWLTGFLFTILLAIIGTLLPLVLKNLK